MTEQLNISARNGLGVRPQLGALAILAAAGLWGTVGVATRALYTLAPAANALSIGFFRLAFSVPALGLAAWLVVGPALFRVARRDLAVMLLMSAMMALYQVCYFAAIARLGVAVAVITTICSAPVLVAGLAALFLRERFTRRMAVALAAALAGTLLTASLSPAAAGQPDQRAAGVLLALGSAAGYAVLTLCSRALAGRYHPLQPITVAFTSGALLLLPFALAGGLSLAYPVAGWLLLLHLGLLPTALAYWLFLRGLQSTPATTASIIVLAEPLTSTLLAAWLFGERLPPSGLAGAALLVGALALLLRG
jgi:DME family drug/metabolite transporter